MFLRVRSNLDTEILKTLTTLRCVERTAVEIAKTRIDLLSQQSTIFRVISSTRDGKFVFMSEAVFVPVDVMYISF